MVVGAQVHFKEGQAGGGGAGVRVRYTEEQLGFGAGILSFHAGGLVLPFRCFQCGSQQSLLSNYFNFNNAFHEVVLKTAICLIYYFNFDKAFDVT